MRSLSPQTWLLLAVIAYAAAIGAVVLGTLRTHWLGVEFEPEPRTGGIRAGKINEAGPASGRLLPGEQLYWIGIAGQPPFPLLAGDLMEDPDLAIHYAAYREFLERQSAIHSRLQAPEVVLGISNDRQVQLQPQASRPLSSLSGKFWFQVFCSFVVFLVTASVWAFRPHDRVVSYFALSGVGLLVTLLPTTLPINRELALDGELLRMLSVTNHLGGLMFVAGLVGIGWNYPRRLARFNFDYVATATLFLVWLADTAQLFNSVNWGYWYPLLGVGAIGVACGVRQWRLSRNDPAARTIINWILLAAIVGPGLYILLFLLPLLTHVPPAVTQSGSWGLLTLFFILMGIGIVRYRLFDLEGAWYLAWAWILGGVAVVSVDLVLVYLFGFRERAALFVSLVVVGFLYLPLRQKIWGLFPWYRRQQSLQNLLPSLLNLALDPGSGASESKWHLALYRVFEPIEIRSVNEPVTEAALMQDGLALRIPGFEGCPAVELYCAWRGGRLFNTRDVEFAKALRQLFERSLVSRKAYIQGAYTERVRVARDLHDDVGAMLLSLVYKSKNPETSTMAREALAKVRAVIHALEGGQRLLSEALPDWRLDTKERLDDANIRLTWWQDELPRDPLLTTRQQINMKRLMQETISNIIKHSRAGAVEVLFSLDDKDLLVSVSDDGVGLDGANTEGSGMNNMRRRVKELGGSIQWQPAGNRGCRVVCTIPFPMEVPGV